MTKFYFDDLCRTLLLAIFAHDALTDVRYKSLIGVIIKINAIRGTSIFFSFSLEVAQNGFFLSAPYPEPFLL